MRNQDNKPIILHIDMDAFFAALEQRDNPALRGKAVIVGGKPGSRGVVCTCSYEARVYGIHAGMSTTEAYRRCPQGHFVRTSGGKYTEASLQLMDILQRYSPVVEPFSIDEAFVDITTVMLPWKSKLELADSIRSAILSELRVTGSIGIATTKLVAKLASKRNKPNGITIIEPEETVAFLSPLPVGSIMGVGKKSLPRFHQLGIFTIGDLLEVETRRLELLLGKPVAELRSKLVLSNQSVVRAHTERESEKSMSHEETFRRNVTSRRVLQAEMLFLVEKVCRRLRRKGLGGTTVTVKLRTAEFETRIHQLTLAEPTASENRIYLAGCNLLEHLHKPGMEIRLLGIKASRLRQHCDTASLLPLDNTEEQFFEANGVVDNLKSIYGDHIVHRASVLYRKRRKRYSQRPSFQPVI
ncbi:MAG: DNA polymerase IV [Candidatus Delongbacteria bacterium]|nr:DNA polymerase IV [Candidatus Delongbacteria bacterium]